MKKSMLALALVACAFAVPTLSQAADYSNGAFINGQAGQSKLKGIHASDDTDTGFAINAGYRWAVSPSVLLGVEGGYVDLGKFTDRAPGASAEFKLSGWNAGVNGKFAIADQWYFSARAGFFSAHRKLSGNAFGISVSGSDTKSKYYGGIGFGYDFSNNVSVGLNYDRYWANDSDVDAKGDLLSVGAEYRF
ncbi:hypothetical protein MBSD_n0912 [Mizugakiibacter sediminis]|uniref:Autotransporter n=1 Tax=Mizugakiibacter sediminis TaxID=1475481 RepID=A0A0K8QMG8_9GAMM|nr:porin family protein [Mizugakiibacter sediminis]GAP65622.1 hypothetical protein MBSD_n0912 [Mizugakiibacter sediminis]